LGFNFHMRRNAKAQFLGVINADAKKAAADMGGDGLDNYAVKVGRCRLPVSKPVLQKRP